MNMIFVECTEQGQIMLDELIGRVRGSTVSMIRVAAARANDIRKTARRSKNQDHPSRKGDDSHA